MLYWHYTTGDDLALILESGSLIPGFNNPFVRGMHKPVNWFTCNQEYEGTIGKVNVNAVGQIIGDTTKQELMNECGGIARIGVEPAIAPHDWQAFKKLSGIRSAHSRALYNTAIAAGSRPSDWFVSFDAIPAEKWAAVEVWTGEGWQAHQSATAE